MARRASVGWRGWIYRASILLATLLSIAAFLPLWSTDRWWVRVLDYPRLQLAGIGIVTLILLVAGSQDYRRRHFGIVVAALVIATMWQLAHTLRYLFVMPKEVATAQACPADKQLKVLNANVLLGNDDFSGLLALVDKTDPDVVLLLEADPQWEVEMASLHARYSFRLAEPIPNSYGMLFYSRLPFDGKVAMRVAEDVPSISGTLTLRDGSSIRLDALHPEPPWPGDDVGERDAELVLAGRDIREDGRAAVAFGDLNDVAWSKTSRLFLEVSGMKDPRVGRGLIPTFNANWPVMRWPLDHLFVSPHWQVVEIRRENHIGSDHFPVYFDICLVRDANERLVKRNPDRDAQEEAVEQVQDGAEEVREGE